MSSSNLGVRDALTILNLSMSRETEAHPEDGRERAGPRPARWLDPAMHPWSSGKRAEPQTQGAHLAMRIDRATLVES
jgi:hypothetical protein